MRHISLLLIGGLVATAPAAAQAPFHEVTRQVNQKLVKVYGSGGFRGLVAYGTGVVVSPDGYVLTAASHLLDTPDLRVHLSDGRRCQAKVVTIEPELDAALNKGFALVGLGQEILRTETAAIVGAALIRYELQRTS